MASKTPRIDNLEATQNKIINGNFDFWQRGSAQVSVSDARTYLADRFFALTNSGAADMGYERSTDVPTIAQADFAFKYSAKLTNLSADTAYRKHLGYRMEGNDIVDLFNKTFTLSFWVKSSIAGDYSLCLKNHNSTRLYTSRYTMDSANTWEQKSITVSMDTVYSNWLTNENTGLEVLWVLSSSANSQNDAWIDASYSEMAAGGGLAAWSNTMSATFQVTGVMLHEGESAGTFKRAGKNIQEELSMCQRFYEKSYNLEDPPETATSAGSAQGAVWSGSDSVSYTGASFRTQKIGTPVVTIYSPSGGGSSINKSRGREDAGGFVDFTTTATWNGENGYSVVVTHTGASKNGSIRWHFTADAEL